jgi:hypothetical protein
MTVVTAKTAKTAIMGTNFLIFDISKMILSLLFGMNDILMAMEAVNASILSGITNVSHYISVAAQAIILYDLFAEISGSDFIGGGIGDDPKDISAACVSSI